MGKVQKVYTKEFKEEAVRLVETSGKSIAQIARELGISDSAIHNWRKELAEHGEEAFPGKGHQTAIEEENRRLKRDLERVQQERDILKKSSEHLLTGPAMKYLFIEEHKHEFAIVVMCNVLAVSESGFYAWRKRPTCRRKQEDAHLTQEIWQVFEMHQGRYGSPRIHRDLYEEGIKCSRKRVARLMREEALSARSKRRRVITTKRDEKHPVAPNLLNRDFHAEEPDKKWASDITYIPTKQGWLYVAVILDLYSRMVVGWSMSGSCDEKLVEHALEQALVRRHPKAGLLHHSDRGSQYTSQAYQAYLQRYGIRSSMSRKGNCWDNAAMESFFGTLKDECVQETFYASHEEARSSIFAYIEAYYNRIRRHSTLGYMSPLQYEKREEIRTLLNV